jgi:hypothetical protein
MNTVEMLNRMCHGPLAGPDFKAICKARGFPAEAEASPGILETLFLSPQGLDGVFATLDSNEIALLHLLKHSPSPVSVSLFSRVYGGKHSYGTFNQRFQNIFAKVKQRLVRSGVLLWTEARQGPREKTSKMGRYRFALPTEFHPHLPPLIQSPRQFNGDGDWRRSVVGDKLSADFGRSAKKAASDAVFQIEAGELRMNGRTFEAANVIRWQQSSWNQAIQDSKKKKPGSGDTRSKQPDEAVRCILSELGDGEWAAPEQLMETLQVFCGQKGGAEAVCEAGWVWGLLAKRRADRKTWYRPAPESPYIAPQDYLTADQDGCVSVDLTAISRDALEQIVAISDQRPSGKAALLATPNFVKLGRADDQLLATESVAWLIEQSQPFADAFVKLSERRGKTVLHEDVTIARVSDLSLKVAIERALGSNLVSLKNDFVAFPLGLLDEVRRVVKKSGHVVKEIAAK